MFYHPQTRRTIPENTSFELDGLQYPSNWLNLSSTQDKIDHGIFELATQTPTFDALQQICVPGPVESISGVWTQTTTVAALPTEAGHSPCRPPGPPQIQSRGAAPPFPEPRRPDVRGHSGLFPPAARLL